MINSVCIVRLSALGDVLMLVPLVRTIQHALPNAKITWIISRPAYDLVEGMENVEFIVIDKPDSIADYWRFYREFKQRSFDVLLAAQASFRANLLYPLIKAKHKIGFDRLRAKDGHHWFIQQPIQPGNDHTLESFLKFADSMGIEQKHIDWNLPISEEDQAWAKQYTQGDKKILLVNPAASKPERSWLIERYIEVIRYAQQQWRVKVILTGGPGEYDRQLADTILSQVDCEDVVGKTKPKQLLALISQADAMLCPDTGPSHMATAVHTPVVALHAVTSSNVSGPYLYRHLCVDYYPQAVETVLNKTAEENTWGTHAHGTDTMRLIPVDDVIGQLQKVFGE